MRVTGLDHLVLTVVDIDRSIAFYREVLGMQPVTFGEGRRALRFGEQQINLHRFHEEHAPHALTPTPGSADLCFLSDTPVEDIVVELARHGVARVSEVVDRVGATGALRSVYLRDPDGNLIEISNRATGQA